MKRFEANGPEIKRLRLNRTRRATQKELAHEVGIGIRQLRLIENENADLPLDVLERIAKALCVPVPSIAIVTDEPSSKSSGPSGVTAVMTIPLFSSKDEVIPRFDTYFASAIRGEAALLELATQSNVVVSHILTNLTAETEAYAEELLTLLESVTRDRRDWLTPIEGKEELRLRRRIRELLVLLKGNDVWVYATDHYKYLPESYLVQPLDARETQWQAIVAFGPPGEYGETTLRVPVDHGQPWVCKGTIAFAPPQKRVEGDIEHDRSGR